VPGATGAKTIGFWQNKNGQAIVGSYSGNQLPGAAVLAQRIRALQRPDGHNCTGVKGYVSTTIKNANSSGASMNTMLKAQMLGTALDVYFSTPGLGGNRISAPAPIGALSIDLTAICRMVDNHSTASATCSNVYRESRAAFGGATSMTVSQMLSYAASQSNDGGSRWYGQVKATQELAKDAFDAINNAVAFLS
jgi:hypothetical protein